MRYKIYEQCALILVQSCLGRLSLRANNMVEGTLIAMRTTKNKAELADIETFDKLNRLGVLGCSDDELLHVSILINDEIKRRAYESGELPSLTESGFERGFTGINQVKDPWVFNGILVAPGGKFEKSPMSHKCSFVQVQERWVWESNQRISDDIRNLPGPGSSMRSVTLVAIQEGDKIDVLSSRARNGAHQLIEVRSFVYHNGALILENSRSVKGKNHR